jgi:hypothetical protein
VPGDSWKRAAEERLVGFKEMMRRSERLPFPTLGERDVRLR